MNPDSFDRPVRNDGALDASLVDAIFTRLPLGLAVFDTTCRLTRINDLLAAATTARPDGNGERSGDAVIPELGTGFQHLVARVLESGLPMVNIEHRGELPGTPGEERVWQGDLHPLRDAENEVVGVIAIVSDVTHAVRAAAALRDSDARFRAAFEQASVGMALVAPEGMVLQANASWCELFGYEPAEMLTLRLYDLSPPEDRRHGEMRFETMRAGAAGAQRYREQCARKDGTRVWVEMNAQPVRNDAGELQSFVAIAQDITDRSRSEEALRSNEQRFRALIENCSDGIALMSVHGRVQYCSAGTTRILGYRLEDFGDTDLFGLVHGEELAALRAAFDECLRRPAAPIPIVARVRHRDGSWRLLEGTVSNLLHDPNIQGIVFNHRDGTQRRQLESQLAEAKRLESVGRLASGVAHDFDALLRLVRTRVAAVRAQLETTHPVLGELAEIESALGRSTSLTRQLLSFAHETDPDLRVMEINNVLREAEPTMRRLVPDDVRLDLDLAPLAGVVRVDSGQVRQVIANLVSNAFEAMEGPGRVVIRTAPVTVSGERASRHIDLTPGEYAEIAVIDDGPGMCPEVRAHAMEPFFTTKAHRGAIGLGLATSYGVARQHGGVLEVESEEGRGTRAVLLLPTAGLQPVRQPSAVPNAGDAVGTGEAGSHGHGAVNVRTPTRGSETVLVVDDDPVVRKVCLRSLKAYGYNVLDASSSAEALIRASEHAGPIHLLLTDVIMPETNGLELAERLRETQPGAGVLYMTGYPDHDEFTRGVQEGRLDYLHKPFVPSTLASKVREVLDRGGARPTKLAA